VAAVGAQGRWAKMV